jgi:hypothetical protein
MITGAKNMVLQRIVLTASVLLLASCSSCSKANDVNKPISQAKITTNMRFDGVMAVVNKFAQENNFAVQENVSQPRGMMEFSVRLFRDDITVMVSKLRSEPIEVASYPLCVCEMGRRVGLQTSADAAVSELSKELSNQSH